MGGVRISLAEFNELAPEDAVAALAGIMACGPWQRVLVAGRPYGSPAELAATSDGVLGALGWDDAQAALVADPGFVPEALRGTEEAAAYQERFGVPFLTDETGRTADDLRAVLADRLAADEQAEQATVRRELATAIRRRLLVTFV